MNGLSWFRRAGPVVRLAPVRTEHAASLAAIHASAFARPWSTLEFERLLADRIVLADGLFFSRRGEPSGFVLSRLAADEAEILTLAFLPKVRGRGHAGPLLRHHLEELARAGARQVHLEVEEGNLPALAAYRRLSFREVGRRSGYYALPDGRRSAALTMSASL
jgi:ribosomal-protein-alanine N-acetyltransferase